VTAESRAAANDARNKRDKDAGIVKRTLRYKDKDDLMFKKLAKQSRDGELETVTIDVAKKMREDQ